MKWYEGTIAEAVAYSQSEKALFCVVILGKDESSQQLEASLNEAEVESLISEDKRFVCIRLNDGTEEHRQFLQLYTNAKSPSIYCITMKGTAIEVITTSLPPAELRSKFESALKRHQDVVLQLGLTNPPAPAATVNTPESTGPAQPTQPSLDERIERAKQLAAAKREKKLAEEAEEQKKREFERRQAGKGLAELKRWQEEEETKKLAEERRKDKQEDAKLRQRLREQIAQDRIDRQARNNPVEPSKKEEPIVTASAPSFGQPRANYSGQARLQFRLPTGASQNHSFDPDTTLGDVRQFLITNAVVPFRDFSISVAFPRRIFSGADYSASLRDLELLPTATLLILPLSGGGSLIQEAGNAGQGIIGFLTTFVSLLLYPITFLLSYVQRALPQAPAAPSTKPSEARFSRPGTSKDVTPNTAGDAANKSKEPSNSSANSGTSSDKSAKDGSSKKVKQGDNFGADGNVYRLRDDSSDDEQATWNGNSTQQM